MKTIIIKSGLLFLLLFFLTGAGCQKEENDFLLWEISPDSETAVIQNVVDSIEFRFCLLDEQGNPSTVFNQGENFYLYFSVTNNKNELIYFNPFHFLSMSDDFFRVYNSDNQDLGRPFNPSPVTTIGLIAYPFPSNSTCFFQIPWLFTDDVSWNLCGGTSIDINILDELSKGTYHTGFEHRFCFGIKSDSSFYTYTDTLHFKINFKIQ